MVAVVTFPNLNKFFLELDEFTDTIVPEEALAFQKKIALDMFKRIVERTPVGNPDLWAPESLPPPEGYVGGRARANWQIAINNPGGHSTDIDRSPDGGGAETNVATVAAVAAMTKAQPFGVISIFNNVPYIERLEFDAWSSQAPAGMVGVTVAEFQAGLTG